MRIIRPNQNFESLTDSVFLAGPMARGNGGGCGWRNDAIEILDRLGFEGDIIDPTNPWFEEMGENAYERQVKWEWMGLRLASAILFWIPRDKVNIGLTTNFELGEWIGEPSCFVGCPEDSYRNRYVRQRCLMIGKVCHDTLESLCEAVVARFRDGVPNVFFTSDTHFGQERTLELSRRPFRDVEEMDMALISNWNKRVRSRDVIYHLGDFGEFGVLPLLNFGRMYFVEGNYERDGKSGDDSALLSDERVTTIPEGSIVELNDRVYRLCHEPLNGLDYWGEWFWLFGHIHRLQIVKENGVNVGCDCHRFAPASLEEVEFLRNGAENHFDENVFCKFVGEEP